MHGQLIPVGGGPPLPLLQQRLVLGRAQDCDLLIAGKSVSSRHCELKLTDGYWWVKDLDSRNGTGINGTRCKHKRLLPNDVLWVAKQRFRVSYDPPSVAGAASSDEEVAAQFLFDEPPAVESSAEQCHSVSTQSSSSSTQSSRDDNDRPGRSTQPQVLGRLVPCGGGDPISLQKEDLLIGRHKRCDIQLKFTNVSSQHCRLFLEGGYWFIEDLNSRNGVRVDGERVQRKALPPAAILTIAKHRYSLEYTATGAEPPPEENPFAQSLLEKAGLQKQVDAAIPPAGTDEPEQRRKFTLDD